MGTLGYTPYLRKGPEGLGGVLLQAPLGGGSTPPQSHPSRREPLYTQRGIPLGGGTVGEQRGLFGGWSTTANHSTRAAVATTGGALPFPVQGAHSAHAVNEYLRSVCLGAMLSHVPPRVPACWPWHMHGSVFPSGGGSLGLQNTETSAMGWSWLHLPASSGQPPAPIGPLSPCLPLTRPRTIWVSVPRWSLQSKQGLGWFW